MVCLWDKPLSVYDFQASGFRTGRLSDFDFQAQSLFADGRWQYGNWIVEAGFDYRRLLDTAHSEQFYREAMPRWGLRRIIPLCERSALAVGYEGDYRLTGTDLPPPNQKDDFNDRVDHSLFVTYSFSLCEHAVLQPYYRFQYTRFTAGETRSDYLNSFGLALFCPITQNVGVRAFIGRELLESTGRQTPEYKKFDAGGGINLTLRF